MLESYYSKEAQSGEIPLLFDNSYPLMGAIMYLCVYIYMWVKLRMRLEARVRNDQDRIFRDLEAGLCEATPPKRIVYAVLFCVLHDSRHNGIGMMDLDLNFCRNYYVRLPQPCCPSNPCKTNSCDFKSKWALPGPPRWRNLLAAGGFHEHWCKDATFMTFWRPVLLARCYDATIVNLLPAVLSARFKAAAILNVLIAVS